VIDARAPRRAGAAVTLTLTLAGCGPRGEAAGPPPAPLARAVVAEFERAVRSSREEFLGLFDFTAVGELEILLHRYDLLGRLPDLSPGTRAEYAAEDGTPYPPERERRNVGGFYPWLIRPSVADGGCAAMTPAWDYNRRLATFEPLPPGNASHEPLRQKVLAYFEGGRGGVVGLACPGGARRLALVYTVRDNARGFDLVTIYDDGPHEGEVEWPGDPCAGDPCAGDPCAGDPCTGDPCTGDPCTGE
jgi:hypothetical protein